LIRPLLTFQTVLAFAAAAPIHAVASDSPSFNNGDCWQVGTPLTCTWNHIGQKGAVYFRAIDQFSSSRSSYSTPIHSAVNAWNSSPGPQFYSFSPAANDVWIYLSVSSTGNHGLTSGSTAITWICLYTNGSCSDTYPSDPVEIWYSDVYLNTSTLDSAGSSTIQSAAAHESGHGMGLWHNTTDSSSIMWPYSGPTVPDYSDWGHYPGCSSSGHGTGCIYGWGD
jgi:hypothetical protein